MCKAKELPVYLYSLVRPVEDICLDSQYKETIQDIIRLADPSSYVFADEVARGVWIQTRNIKRIKLLSQDLDKLSGELSSKFRRSSRGVVHRENWFQISLSSCIFPDDVCTAATQDSGARVLSTHNLMGHLLKKLARGSSANLRQDFMILRQYYHEDIENLALSVTEKAVYEELIRSECGF